jgi:ABC-type transporter Mla subunit MlaD
MSAGFPSNGSLNITTLEQVLDALKDGHASHERAIRNVVDTLNHVMREHARYAGEIAALRTKLELLASIIGERAS